MDSALNNQQWLICHKIKPKKSKVKNNDFKKTYG